MKFGHKKLYIGGELIAAANGKIHEVVCPASEMPVATISWASQADTARALKAAEEGFTAWSQLPISQRQDWMLKLRSKILERQDLLRNSIMYEMGKVWEGTEEDLTSITNSLQFYAEEIELRQDEEIPDRDGTHTHRLVSQPLGVAVAFLAYNFPLLNLGFKLGPALAAGCSIIIKPSEYSPLSAYLIGEICHEIDFPAGVINIICGDTSEVGVPLCESKVPRLITMIGSTETAQKLITQSSQTSLKRFSMECGGNAPFIVFDDADLNLAISHGVALKVGNAGQICVAPNRFFIQESVVDHYVAEMKRRFEQIKIGFGRENKPDMGPLANQSSLIRVSQIVDEAVRQGGELICGGQRHGAQGHYFQPTIIRFENENAPILQQEVFGPVAFIIPFQTQEEVITMANNTDAGLASYVYSSDPARLDFFSTHLQFGEVQLNGLKYDIYLPHGGIKNSGIGVDCSSYALDDYLIRKRVTMALT